MDLKDFRLEISACLWLQTVRHFEDCWENAGPRVNQCLSSECCVLSCSFSAAAFHVTQQRSAGSSSPRGVV